MPSDSPGRYQSRLFNFLNQQSHRLTEQVERTVRHLKVAAVWGTQALLYPLYLLVQSGLSTQQQLSSTAPAKSPQLNPFIPKKRQKTPPASDTPIQRVLSDVKTALIPAESASQNAPCTLVPCQTALSSTQAGDAMQGVATLLAERTLVLVTANNQILDILTPQQQQKLSSRMSWEVADFWRQRRLALRAKRTILPHRLTQLAQPYLSPPLKVFSNLMAWVQATPVAIATNLFEKSRLVDRTDTNSNFILSPGITPQASAQLPPSPSSEIAPQLAVHKALAFVDRTVAELESHQLVPGSEVVVTLSRRTAQTLRHHLQKLHHQLQTHVLTQPTATPETSSAHSVRIQALIYAAIDYFFGKHRLSFPGTSPERSPLSATPHGKTPQLFGRHASVALPPNLDGTDTLEPDPWLTWNDLFGPNLSGITSHPLSTSQGSEALNAYPLLFVKDETANAPQLPESFSSKLSVKRGNSIWGTIKQFLKQETPATLSAPSTGESASVVVHTNQPKTPVKHQGIPTTQHQISPTATDSGNTSLSSATAATTAISTTSSPEVQLEAAPEWIETQATPMGYVKHPLEQILEWLDFAMVWIEEQILKVWRWIKQLKG